MHLTGACPFNEKILHHNLFYIIIFAWTQNKITVSSTNVLHPTKSISDHTDIELSRDASLKSVISKTVLPGI